MLTREWFSRDATVVAPDLLNKVLRVESESIMVSGRIVETEAYMPDDPASHSFNGPTDRNRVMFGPAGHLYVYLSYGIHRCANVVTGSEARGQAVLIRAVTPVDGLAIMRERRGRPDRELADGPGKVCQALGIELEHNGVDLLAGVGLTIEDDGLAPPSNMLTGPRVGISKAAELPWRYRVPA